MVRILDWLAPPFLPCDERRRRPVRFRWVEEHSWIGYTIGWSDRYVGFASALGVGALGLVLAASWASPRWAHAFIHSQGWALLAVTAWVLAWGAWSDRQLDVLHHRVRPALRRPLDEQEILIWRRRFYDVRRDLLVGTPISGFFIWLIVANSQLWRARFPNWQTHQHVAEVLFACWVGLGGYILVTMLYGLWNYLSFAAFVLRKPLTGNLVRARTHLQALTAFGLATGLGWSVAVALFADIAVRNGHAIAFTVAAALAVLGFALIVAPQFLAHQALLRARNEQIAAAQDEQEIEALAAQRTWIQSPVDALIFLAQVAAAIGAIAAAA